VIATIIIAAAIAVIALIVNLREAAAAFLVAYVSVVSVVLGTLALTLIAHLTTATWFRPFRARAERVIDTLPALAAVGVLLPIAAPTLYPWSGAPSPARAYLNTPFFIARWITYWAAWIGIGAALRRARRLYAVDVDRANARFRRVACVGLIVLAVTMTFASFDWMMSLSTGWQSTIYGLYWFAGGLLSGLALLAILAATAGESSEWITPSDDDVHAVGKLLTTFVLFWLYTGFSQYIVIWSGDLPNEVTWYVPRTHGGWGYVAAVLVLGNFALPFLLLLFRPIKRSRAALAAIGALLLALHYVDMFWVVMPGLVAVRWWTVLVGIALLTLVSVATWGLVVSRRRRPRAQTLQTHGSEPAAGLIGGADRLGA